MKVLLMATSLLVGILLNSDTWALSSKPKIQWMINHQPLTVIWTFAQDPDARGQANASFEVENCKFLVTAHSEGNTEWLYDTSLGGKQYSYNAEDFESFITNYLGGYGATLCSSNQKPNTD